MSPDIDRAAERQRWLLFQLFLVRECRLSVNDAAAHIAWIQHQKFEGQPFETVDAWFGTAGTTWRQRDARAAIRAAVPGTVQHAWVFFQSKHGARSAESLEHTLQTLNTTGPSQESR